MCLFSSQKDPIHEVQVINILFERLDGMQYLSKIYDLFT
ncbi:hypothetical protein N007_06240 [Alicyclobacillus acidoterrestris ATCC 49025]|nr:hypothetical protein N007_06240 [Alicyclobacillus acidoterrestris ATCC 49025]